MTYNFLKKIAISTIGIAMGSMIQAVPSLAASITIANPEFQDPVIKSGALRRSVRAHPTLIGYFFNWKSLMEMNINCFSRNRL